MVVLFAEKYENRFQIGAANSPRYMQVYDLQKIYPELESVYEAKKNSLSKK